MGKENQNQTMSSMEIDNPKPKTSDPISLVVLRSIPLGRDRNGKTKSKSPRRRTQRGCEASKTLSMKRMA
ncbi:hypothetical protein RchiOBHm_Chr5g0054921 [Rosa chinensis]|uniref:Uncharacterized protein n=1 Tax=Rosa chinensis TaxID=74649 RepID=A0A2P6QGA5_ROSCH|nr:hypothetical protein RchiOBHm_Chr5g0054921 [Rosa chinensis]